MSALSIRLQTRALDDLQKKAAQIGREPEAALYAARGAANLARQYLLNLDVRSPRSHFYSAASKSIAEPFIEAGGAAFTINKVGLAQRWLGGDIHAGAGTSSATGGPTRYLAIGTDEVEGKTPKEVSMEQDVAYVPRRNGKAMLVQGMRTISTRGPHKGETVIRANPGGLVLFWLVPDVRQEADPTVLPVDEDLAEEARYYMDKYLSRLLETGAGGAN